VSTTARPNTTSTSERTFPAGLKSTRFRFLPGAGAASWSVAAPDVAPSVPPACSVQSSIRARRTIDVPLRSNKPVLLAALVRARAAAPDVPRPAAAPAAAAAGGGGEALIAPTDGVEKLVGQRVEAVWEDKDGSTDWFPATIVAHWPTNSEHDRLLMHFDDGMDEIITLPDDTVRLTGEAVVARCKCARCAVRPEAEDGGCTLPLPQPARPRRRS